MRRTLLYALMFFLCCPLVSHGFSSKGQDCSKCHTLKKDEAAALLKDVIPNVKVLDIKTTPFKAVWELDVESNGKKGLVYLDLSKRFLLSGALVDIKGKKNLTQEKLSELNKVNVSEIPLKDAIVLGDKNARNRVIVFDDPE